MTTLKFTTFYDYARKADPIAVNILRDGVSLLDTGFFDPMQALLYRGLIKPTNESIHIYANRSYKSMENSKQHLLHAVLDLYWAVIDAAHACLMHYGKVPPSPAYVPEMMQEELCKKHKLKKKYVEIAREFYDLMKMITHGDIKEISGQQYDNYLKEAEDFVEKMNHLIGLHK